jgi:hypothetical protein
LFEDLRARGQAPPVLDARQLLLDPEHVLRELCDRLGIPWDAAMLSWPAGPQPEDGIWARYWYDNLHQSTGFAPYRPRNAEVPESCRDLLRECRRHYDELAGHAIRAARAEAS